MKTRFLALTSALNRFWCKFELLGLSSSLNTILMAIFPILFFWWCSSILSFHLNWYSIGIAFLTKLITSLNLGSLTPSSVILTMMSIEQQWCSVAASHRCSSRLCALCVLQIFIFPSSQWTKKQYQFQFQCSAYAWCELSKMSAERLCVCVRACGRRCTSNSGAIDVFLSHFSKRANKIDERKLFNGLLNRRRDVEKQYIEMMMAHCTAVNVCDVGILVMPAISLYI